MHFPDAPTKELVELGYTKWLGDNNESYDVHLESGDELRASKNTGIDRLKNRWVPAFTIKWKGPLLSMRQLQYTVIEKGPKPGYWISDPKQIALKGSWYITRSKTIPDCRSIGKLPFDHDVLNHMFDLWSVPLSIDLYPVGST